MVLDYKTTLQLLVYYVVYKELFLVPFAKLYSSSNNKFKSGKGKKNDKVFTYYPKMGDRFSMSLGIEKNIHQFTVDDNSNTCEGITKHRRRLDDVHMVV